MPNYLSLVVTALAGSAAAEITVALYGGGPANGVLANALMKYEHINVQYYDPALNLTPTSFRLLGLSPKAWDALELVSPEAGNAINRAGWYPEDPSIIVMGQGPDAGKTVLDYEKMPNVTGRPDVAVTDPAPFMMDMLKDIDPSRLHANTSLVNINAKSDKGPVELTFDDGTSLTANVLIGDDGIMSTIRPYVLGPQDDATFPVFMKFLSAVGHVPPKEAQRLIGSPYTDRTHRWERVGNGSWFLDAYLDGFFTCLGSFYTEEDYDLSQFTRETTPEEIKHYWKDYEGSDGIIEALTKYTGLRLIPEVEHLPAKTYIKGPVAMMGNAAHTMTNFQQLGPNEQIADGAILGALLGAATDQDGVAAALKAFDAVRRPRAQHVSEQGKRLGKLWTGKTEAGIDVKKLRQAFIDWREDMESFSLIQHLKEAQQMMAKELQAAKVQLTGPTDWLQGFLGLRQSQVAMGSSAAHESL